MPIGQTSGFGTVQFSLKTSKAIDTYLSAEKNFKDAGIVKFPDNNSAVAGLNNGTIDAHFLDDLTQRHEVTAAFGHLHRLAIPIQLDELAKEHGQF